MASTKYILAPKLVTNVGRSKKHGIWKKTETRMQDYWEKSFEIASLILKHNGPKMRSDFHLVRVNDQSSLHLFVLGV